MIKRFINNLRRRAVIEEDDIDVKVENLNCEDSSPIIENMKELSIEDYVKVAGKEFDKVLELGRINSKYVYVIYQYNEYPLYYLNILDVGKTINDMSVVQDINNVFMTLDELKIELALFRNCYTNEVTEEDKEIVGRIESGKLKGEESYEIYSINPRFGGGYILTIFDCWDWIGKRSLYRKQLKTLDKIKIELAIYKVAHLIFEGNNEESVVDVDIVIGKDIVGKIIELDIPVDLEEYGVLEINPSFGSGYLLIEWSLPIQDCVKHYLEELEDVKVKLSEIREKEIINENIKSSVLDIMGIKW